MNILWYDTSATNWHEALPIGNGIIGGMVFGGSAADRVALNHESLWRGKTRMRTTRPVHEHLPHVRELFFQGRLQEASAEAVRYLSDKNQVQPYQPLGDLSLYCAGHETAADYRRQLDLAEGVAEVRYVRHSTRYERKYLASVEQGALAVHLSADRPGSISVRVHLGRIDDDECVCTAWSDAERIGLSGRFDEGVTFVMEARVVAWGGQICPGPDATLDIDGADAVTVYVRADVGLDGDIQEDLWKDTLPAFEAVECAHRAEHRALFHRMSLDLGAGPDDRPADVRLRTLAIGHEDPDLLATYFQYGGTCS